MGKKLVPVKELGKRRYLKGARRAKELFGLWRSEGRHEPYLLVKGNPPAGYLPATTVQHGVLHAKASKIYLNDVQIATIRADRVVIRFIDDNDPISKSIAAQIEAVLIEEGLMKDV